MATIVAGKIKVGAAVVVPESSLHVDEGTATACAIKLTAGTTTGQSSTDGLELGITTTGEGEIRQKENLDLVMYANNLEKLRILANGGIKINPQGGGTAVETASGVVKIGSGGSAATIASETGSLADDRLKMIAAGGFIFRSANGAGRDFVFQQTSSTELARLINSGKLGLGLAAPVAKLHLDEGTATACAVKLTAGSTTGQLTTDGLELGITTTGEGEIRQKENLDLVLYTNNTERLRVKADGSIVSPKLTRTLSVVFGPVGNITTGEDDLLSYNVLANTLANNGESLKISCCGVFGATANSKRLRLKFGATTIYDSGTLTDNGGAWKIVAEIFRVGASSQIAIAEMAGDTQYTTPTADLTGNVLTKATGEAVATDDLVNQLLKTTYEPA